MKKRNAFTFSLSRANHSLSLRTLRSGDKSAGQGHPALPALPLPIQKSKIITRQSSIVNQTKVAGASPLQAVTGASRSGDPEAELDSIINALRRAIRLKNMAVSTEETYVYWNCRFIRFCHQKLGQSPQAAGPSAITAYLDFLALERNVAPATQKQALNAMAFLVKNVFGIAEFTLDHITPACGQRRPPVVMTRAEVRSVIARLEGPWKLAAQLMYGSGLRVMETLRLRVKDLDFGQGTITIHDGKGGRHRIVPLPKTLEQRLNDHLAAAHAKHLQDLAVGAGDVHMPEALLRKWPKATREWCWQYLFASATLCPHPRTGRMARHHLHETSMQRQFKDAVRKAAIPKRHMPHDASFIRDPLTGVRHRHPHRPIPSGPRERRNHDDLPPRHEASRSWRTQPARSRLNSHPPPNPGFSHDRLSLPHLTSDILIRAPQSLEFA
jgi:integron integrase